MNSGDTITGGSGTDTLDINKAAILGGLNVDLTNASDQVVSFNGSATTGTVLGFENVDASGYTGSFGAQLTGSSVANTLTGTANADVLDGAAGGDNLTGGAGADTISGGAGDDTIAGGDDNDTITGGAGGDTITGGGGVDTITAGTGADNITGGVGLDTITLGAGGDIDTVFFTTTGDGGSAGTDSTGDTITGFVSTEDKISLDGALATALDDIADNTALAFGSTGINDGNTGAAVAANITTTDELLFLDSANSGVTAANLGDISVVVTALEAQITLTSANTNDALVAVESTTTGTFGVYLFVETTTNTNQFDDAEVTLLGIVTADDVVATDFITT